MTPSLYPVSDRLDCTVSTDGGDMSVSFEGAVDFYTAGKAKRWLLALLDHEPARLTIDAKGAFVDSAGIGVSLHVAQRARLERRSFRLLCDERLQQLLRLHQLDAVLGISDVVPEAGLRTPSSAGRLAA